MRRQLPTKRRPLRRTRIRARDSALSTGRGGFSDWWRTTDEPLPVYVASRRASKTRPQRFASVAIQSSVVSQSPVSA